MVHIDGLLFKDTFLFVNNNVKFKKQKKNWIWIWILHLIHSMFDKILNINFDLKFPTKITTKKKPKKKYKTEKHDFFIRNYLFLCFFYPKQSKSFNNFLLNISAKPFSFLFFFSILFTTIKRNAITYTWNEQIPNVMLKKV